MYYHFPSKTTSKIFAFTLQKLIHLVLLSPVYLGLTNLKNKVKNTQNLHQTWFQFQVPKLKQKQHNSNFNILSKHNEETRDSCRDSCKG